MSSLNPIWSHIARFSKKKKKKNDWKCSEYVGTCPGSFLCWLDYFWVSYGNQIDKAFLNNHEQIMLTSVENEW